MSISLGLYRGQGKATGVYMYKEDEWPPVRAENKVSGSKG